MQDEEGLHRGLGVWCLPLHKTTVESPNDLLLGFRALLRETTGGEFRVYRASIRLLSGI